MYSGNTVTIPTGTATASIMFIIIIINQIGITGSESIMVDRFSTDDLMKMGEHLEGEMHAGDLFKKYGWTDAETPVPTNEELEEWGLSREVLEESGDEGYGDAIFFAHPSGLVGSYSMDEASWSITKGPNGKAVATGDLHDGSLAKALAKVQAKTKTKGVKSEKSAAPPVGNYEAESHPGAVCSNCGRTVTNGEYSSGESDCCHADVTAEEFYGQ